LRFAITILLISVTAEDLFGHGWFKPFCALNKHGVNTLISLIEIIILNSIKRQEVG
jgi:hypothetical protein